MSETTTPTRDAGLLVALIVVGLGIAAFMAKPNGPFGPAGDDFTEQIVLSTVFTPDLRDTPIHLTAHVEGVVVAEELLTRSPYNATIRIPRGAQVSMHVTQEESGHLDCMIQVNGITADHNTREDLGSVRCWYNRRDKS